MNKCVQLHNITNENKPDNNTPHATSSPSQSPSQNTHSDRSTQNFNEKLAESLFNGESLKTSKILSFAPSPSPAEKKKEEHHQNLRVVIHSFLFAVGLVLS
jgi:hypothetical protein